MPSIYGEDDNAFAESVASSALGKPSEYKHSGAPSGEDGSKGVRPQDPGPIKVTDLGEGSDSRAVSKGDCPK